MPELWRISNYPSLAGVGGLKREGRWHSRGRPIVYLASSPGSALLEVLVHLELKRDQLPKRYTFLRVSAPEAAVITNIDLPTGEEWKNNLILCRRLGDEWMSEAQTALAKVLSAILPGTWNYLLNPLHPDARNIEILGAEIVDLDARLVRLLRK